MILAWGMSPRSRALPSLLKISLTSPYRSWNHPPQCCRIVTSLLGKAEIRDESGCTIEVPVPVYSLANDYSLPGASQILVLVITETVSVFQILLFCVKFRLRL